MAKWKGITAPELIVLREIERINRQIREAAKQFGTSSGLYKQYETMIAPNDRIAFGVDMVRETKTGIIQLSASRRSVREMMTYSSYEKRLQRLGKMDTVATRKEQYIKAYEIRTGRKPRSRKEREEIFKGLISEENALFREADGLWQEIYERIRKTGTKPVEWEDMKRLAKDARSDRESLKELIRIQRELLQKERWEAVKNVVEGY